MGVALLDLVETALRVAKQALGKRAGKPDSGGLAREAHIVAHCIRKGEGHSYAELVDRVSLMPAVCDRLGVHPDAPPDPTTFYHSFDRYAMYVWPRRARQHVLRTQPSLAVLPPTLRAEREDGQSDDTDRYRVAGGARRALLYRARTRHEGWPRVVRRNADDLRAVAADNGFQDWHTEYEIAALDVEYLVHYRGSTLKPTANDALIRAKGYTQRWMAETSYSTVKRTQDSALRSRFWYRQFREIVLLFALNNIKKLAKTL